MNQIPLYFRKSELINAFKKANPGVEVPSVKVTELISVVSTMLNPDMVKVDSDIEKLIFIPPAESSAKAAECKKKGGKEQPYQLGKRILIL